MTGKIQKDGYHIVDFPRIREIVVDVMVPAQNKHMIHVLFEADVTNVRKYLKKKKTEGAAVPSLTAFIVKCAADDALPVSHIRIYVQGEPLAGNAARVDFYANGSYFGWAAPILAPGGGGVGLGSPLICLNPNAGQACHLLAGDPKLGQGCHPLLG